MLGSSDGVLFALAALLADGNGRGGGDLNWEGPPVGSWAGCRIALATKEPGVLPADFFDCAVDVSERLLEVLSKAEGDYTGLAHLASDSVFSRKWLRALPGRAAQRLSTLASRHAKCDSDRLNNMEDLFHLFGVPSALTHEVAEMRLAQGLCATALELGRPERYEVRAMRWLEDRKRTAATAPGGEVCYQETFGVAHLSCELVDSGAVPRRLVVRFGHQGSSASQVYQQVFPGLDLCRNSNDSNKE